MKEITTPHPLLRQKAKAPDGTETEVVLGLLWFCRWYLDRSPVFAYQTAGAAGLRAAGRIEDALLGAQEPGDKARLHDDDCKSLQTAVESGDVGAPQTGLSIGTEPVTVPDRALLRFIDAIAGATEVTEERAQAAE
jgi:hypothetical protein